MSGSKVGHAIIAYGYDRSAGTITVWDPWKATGGSHTITAAKLAADMQPDGMDTITGHTDADLASLGDQTGDGTADLVAADRASGQLWLYPGGTKALGTRVQIGTSGWNGMNKLTGVGDITGDGRPNLIAVRTSDGTLWVYPGADKAVGTRKQLGTSWNGIRSLTYTGDVTGDGVSDLIGVQSNTGVMYVYGGRSTGFAARVQLTAGWNG